METQSLIAAFVLGPAFGAVLAYDTWALCVNVRRRMTRADRRSDAGRAVKPLAWSCGESERDR
jgi:hypothetical protein